MIRILSEQDVRGVIGPLEAIGECRVALAKLGRGEVELPDVLTIEVREHRGEVHGKGGYLHGTPYFSIKVATAFRDNPIRGLPFSSGAVWVFDATTGFLKLLLLDNGYLTELRTGAAGAVAAEALAKPDIETVGMIGAGVQARYQLEALLQVRAPLRVLAWSRDPERARVFSREATERFGVPTVAVATPEEVVRSSDLIVTCTASDTPIVEADWVRPGTHITAMGSDMAHKRELEPELLARATVFPDRLSQCLTQGEIHHAVAAGILRIDQVGPELGEVVAGLKPGRTWDDEITIADQTGVGVLDAAVANFVARAVESLDTGRCLDV